MNRNRKIKVVAAAITTGMIIGTVGATVDASPIAGAVASIYSPQETQVIDSVSPLSGTSLAISRIIATVSAGVGMEVDEHFIEDDAPYSVPVSISEESVNPYADVAIAVAEDYVNIRAAASTDAEPIGKLYNNGYAKILEIEGEWAHIASGTVDGYVNTEFLNIGDKDYITHVSRLVTRTEADVLNIREDMSLDSAIVGKSGQGNTLDIVDASMAADGWLQVSTGDGVGYVSTEFVSIERAYASVAESKAEEEARLAAQAAAEAARIAAQNRANSNRSTSSGGGSTYTQAPDSRTYNPPAGSDGSSVVDFAMQFVGNPYVYGGTSLTNGTDCSGFVMSVYNNFGVSLPHSSSSLRSVGVGVSDMQPGDIVCYSGHVGIYAGNGQIVHASNRRDGIKVSSAYYRNILAVRRVFN